MVVKNVWGYKAVQGGWMNMRYWRGCRAGKWWISEQMEEDDGWREMWGSWRRYKVRAVLCCREGKEVREGTPRTGRCKIVIVVQVEVRVGWYATGHEDMWIVLWISGAMWQLQSGWYGSFLGGFVVVFWVGERRERSNGWSWQSCWS